MMMRPFGWLLAALLFLPCFTHSEAMLEEEGVPDVVFVPTPPEVVDVMLQLANVTSDDVVYDLGSGDGRIVIAAAQKFGCRAVGYEIDPVLVRQSRINAIVAGVEHLVEFVEGDIFKLDLSGASVITLYLLPELNVRLIPQLQQLAPGSRIVSHAFDMRGVVPGVEARVLCDDGMARAVYLWKTPFEVTESDFPSLYDWPNIRYWED
jgi:SAM-dependent methyltransferase